MTLQLLIAALSGNFLMDSDHSKQPNNVPLRPKSHLLYGGRTPSELTETCGGRSVSEVASGWPYVVWLYFTSRRGAVEL